VRIGENMIKPKTVSGVMELLPKKQITFDKMIEKIKKTYQSFGFVSLETPLMELSQCLLAKSGGDTQKQVYFAIPTGSLERKEKVPKYALKFDLTVPLARFVAQNEQNLVFPFKRYQIQKVYRGESAQKGRYREFYQCDIDIVGKNNLSFAYDGEVAYIIYKIFKNLNIGKFTIQINNRKLFIGLFESLNLQEMQEYFLRQIDKLSKIGIEKVEELICKKAGSKKTKKIIDFINLKKDIMCKLEEFEIKNETFSQGLRELKEVIFILETLGLPKEYYKIDLSVARGLDYYTSTIYETTLENFPKIGSICSGGRYDNLAGNYTKTHLPGVGISIGATRLFYLLDKLDLLDKYQSFPAKVMIAMFDKTLTKKYAQTSKILHEHNISNFIYWPNDKIKKQFKYASKLGIPYVLIIGKDEAKENLVTIKNMLKGTQEKLSVLQILKKI